ncbi:DUF3365 domain-containing protein [Oxynema sp. CENA135]|uniref:Tll0287-like domain-containing protein n=1 Tax=Oxynema sp. CENA135 TaxID=984206 RepID=UPI00190A6704|nr:DUF3365 domain-containing protein [Oxynema sp. CENA135]MBK4731703.1 DUF3365 domain-containing protein [Oxynema sp. CENA135]
MWHSNFSKLSKLSKLFISLCLALFLLGWHPQSANAQTNPQELAKAVREIEYLDSMRSELAATIDPDTEPTMQTMKEVCKPVGMRAQELAKENNWQVKQIAKKYRNPAHAPDGMKAEVALNKFDLDSDLVGFWDRETIDGREGTRYYRRINVEASCLACHGAKNDRPQFVKDNYPNDLAYNFNPGDLRGMYSVFIPDVREAIDAAIAPQ